MNQYVDNRVQFSPHARSLFIYLQKLCVVCFIFFNCLVISLIHEWILNKRKHMQTELHT